MPETATAAAPVSLRAYLARLVWTCVAPLLALSAWFALGDVLDTRSDQERSGTELSRNAAAIIDRQLKSRVGSLEVLAKSPLVRDPARHAELYESARAHVEVFGNHVILADPQGRMLFNTRVPFGSALPSLPRVEGTAAAPTALATLKPAVGDRFVGPVAREQLVAIAVPVLKDGKATHLLLATVDAGPFQRTLENLALPDRWQVVLRDSKGEAIAWRGPTADPGAGREGERFRAPLENAKWSIAVSMPPGEDTAVVLRSALALAFLVAVAGVTSLLAGRRAASRLRRAIGTIASPSETPSGNGIPAIEEVEAIRERLARMERDRRESETRFTATFEQAAVGLLLVSADGVCERANETLGHVLGLSPEAIRGRRFADIGHPDDLDRIREFVRRARAGEIDRFRAELRLLRADGQPVWVNLSASLATLAGEDASHFIVAVEDIGERRRAEERLRKLSLAVDQSEAMVIITDLAQRIEYVNDAFERQTGFSREAAIGRIPRELIGSGRTPDETYASLGRALADGATWQGEFINRRRDGSEFTSRATITPLRQPDGAITHYVGVQEDVTAARRLGAEVERHRHHLEELVVSRTAQLDEANRAKSAFLANMSHEIRTPMNAILGFASVLARSSLAPADRERVDRITAAAKHLMALINDILDLSKIEAGRLELERTPFALAPMVADVRSLVGESARAKGIELAIATAGTPEWVRGDPVRIRQALLNYASNAVKFTQRGRVSIRVSTVAEEGERVCLRFEVEDSGPGIAAATLATLFQPFQQGDAPAAQRYGGTGLGLAITRRLATMMGGEAGAATRPGEGSTFWFTAWLERAEATDARAAEVASDALAALRQRHAGKRVLLVEDEPINREVALLLLEDTGLAVDVAGDGREAVARAASGYDAILMDMRMPEMDGLEATRAIRAMPGGAAVPIVAMTANAYEEDRRQCLEAGMDDFIAKPVDPAILHATLLRGLDRAQGLA